MVQFVSGDLLQNIHESLTMLLSNFAQLVRLRECDTQSYTVAANTSHQVELSTEANVDKHATITII
jgi:hypothetical protein